MRLSLTIFQKGMILVGLPFLIQMVYVWLIVDLDARRTTAQDRSAHTKEVLAQARLVLTLLIDEETGVRGFVITQDSAHLEALDRAGQELPAALERLQALVADIPDGQEQARRIVTEATSLFELHSAEVRQVRSGRVDEATARVKTGRGKSLMDALRARIGHFVETAERRDQDLELDVAAAGNRLRWAFLTGTVSTFVAVLTLAFVFHRIDTHRIAMLSDNAQRLADGNELTPPLDGRDEIAQVDRAFREMAGKLKKTRQAVEEKHDLLRSILDGMGEALTLIDKQGNFVLANPQVERILGVPPTGSYLNIWTERLRLYLPDKVSAFPTEDLPSMKALRGEPSDGVEIFVRHPERPDGFWISASARPLFDASGGVRGSVAVFSDVTHRKFVEAKVRTINQELERRVEQRTAELAEANRDLCLKNEENETFVFSVSHDLRSPLVNLQGFSKELGFLCKDLRGLITDREVPVAVRERGLALIDGPMAKSMGFIQSAVMRVSHIIDALLRLSRAGRVAYQAQPVDLRNVVGGIVDALKGTIEERKAKVIVNDLPPAHGDPTALEQLFANLIVNALYYLDPSRPGIIEVSALDGASSGTAPRRTFYVKDNGLGIPEAYRSKMFKAFQRLHPGAAPGEGMGLVIVHRIVERHRGKIWLESSEGQGSTFFVTLPTAAGSRPAAQASVVELGERGA